MSRSWVTNVKSKWEHLSVGRKIFLAAYGLVVGWAALIVWAQMLEPAEQAPSRSRAIVGDKSLAGGPINHFIRYRNSYDSFRKSGPNSPAWQRYAAAAPAVLGRPMVAIVIDDMGPDQKNARRAMNMQAPLTLAFLPYANELTPMIARARASGHEVLLHLPMEPENGDVHFPGPNSLKTDLPSGELSRRLKWNLDRFKGYVGINNHMGSLFTADQMAMARVMDELRVRGLLFLDSRTTTTSVGRRVAMQSNVPFGRRDVFLDNDRGATQVLDRLHEVEAIARKSGSAIAIGHPHDQTLDALERWIGDLEGKGFVLAPVSAVIAKNNRTTSSKN